MKRMCIEGMVEISDEKLHLLKYGSRKFGNIFSTKMKFIKIFIFYSRINQELDKIHFFWILFAFG
jgi:hypothetical protein